MDAPAPSLPHEALLWGFVGLGYPKKRFIHVVFSCPLDPGEALSPKLAKPRRFSESESKFVGAWPRADSTTLGLSVVQCAAQTLHTADKCPSGSLCPKP